MFLQHWEVFHQQLSEIVLELFPNKRIKDGTDAKVNVSNITSDLKNKTPFLCLVTGYDFVLHQEDDVEGGPAHEEQQHDDEDQSDCLELCDDPG